MRILRRFVRRIHISRVSNIRHSEVAPSRHHQQVIDQHIPGRSTKPNGGEDIHRGEQILLNINEI